MNNWDYTAMEIGHVLADGRMISKCPKCGKNGVATDLGRLIWYQHYDSELFQTASGDTHAKRRRPNQQCRVTKNNF